MGDHDNTSSSRSSSVARRKLAFGGEQSAANDGRRAAKQKRSRPKGERRTASNDMSALAISMNLLLRIASRRRNKCVNLFEKGYVMAL